MGSFKFLLGLALAPLLLPAGWAQEADSQVEPFVEVEEQQDRESSLAITTSLEVMPGRDRALVAIEYDSGLGWKKLRFLMVEAVAGGGIDTAAHFDYLDFIFTPVAYELSREFERTEQQELNKDQIEKLALQFGLAPVQIQRDVHAALEDIARVSVVGVSGRWNRDAYESMYIDATLILLGMQHQRSTAEWLNEQFPEESLNYWDLEAGVGMLGGDLGEMGRLYTVTGGRHQLGREVSSFEYFLQIVWKFSRKSEFYIEHRSTRFSYKRDSEFVLEDETRVLKSSYVRRSFGFRVVL